MTGLLLRPPIPQAVKVKRYTIVNFAGIIKNLRIQSHDLHPVLPAARAHRSAAARLRAVEAGEEEAQAVVVPAAAGKINRLVMRILFLFCFCLSVFAIHAQNKTRSPQIGIVQHIENDSLLHAFGFTCLVEATPKLLSPEKVSDHQFQEYVQAIKKLRVPLLACNILIPGNLKVVGPEVHEAAVLSYLEKVFQRAQQADIHLFTWGSGGSRRIPDGFDRAQAKSQFIAIAKKIASLAAQYNITLAIENLNSTETNFINTVAEALDIVKAIDHTNIRLCVDIYHMLKENESPEIILKSKPYTIYCEVAEKEGRTPPGVHGQDFTPYLRALKAINYQGKIVIECQWQNIDTQGSVAYQSLDRQIQHVF